MEAQDTELNPPQSAGLGAAEPFRVTYRATFGVFAQQDTLGRNLDGTWQTMTFEDRDREVVEHWLLGMKVSYSGSEYYSDLEQIETNSIYLGS